MEGENHEACSQIHHLTSKINENYYTNYCKRKLIFKKSVLSARVNAPTVTFPLCKPTVGHVRYASPPFTTTPSRSTATTAKEPQSPSLSRGDYKRHCQRSVPSPIQWFGLNKIVQIG